MKSTITILTHMPLMNKLFSEYNSKLTIVDELRNVKVVNELLAILLLLFIWLWYRYKRRHSIELIKKEKLHKLVYYNEVTKLPTKNKYYLDMDANTFYNFDGVFVSLVIDNLTRFFELYDSNRVNLILKNFVDILTKRDGVTYLYHFDSGAFIVFLGNMNDEEAKFFCKELATDVALNTKDGISLSFGLHKISGETDLREVYRITRVASRLAKRFSYEKILYASHEEIEKYQESLRIEEDIPRALMQNEFIPYFQPKVDLITNKVVGCEALIRWNHFSGKMIFPDRFISIAEETNTIIDLDLMIAEKSVEIVKKWLDNKDVCDDFRLSFNLSSKTFISPGIMLKLMNILSKYNFNPRNLEIELTETIVVSDFDYFSKIIEELNLLGIHISLDDFTAGYSSTEYLTKLKIDSVKLDRGLILETEMDNENGKKKRGMYRILVQMLTHLGLNAVSEGLDDVEHYNLIKESGVKIGQGYYFSKPLDENKFIEFVYDYNNKNDGN